MATCPLCSERAGKRFCPAKDAKICAICCGTKREIEIDCPSFCPYLKASRSYESDKPIPVPELVAKVRDFNPTFLEQFQPILDALTITVIETRADSPWMVDHDVIAVFKALTATMKTLSGGIYYESLPDGPLRQSLFRHLKELLDKLMQPQPEIDAAAASLKVSEALNVLDFLTFAAQLNSSVRPKSRRYLDWIGERFGERLQAQQPGGLIIP